jgi:hypothetical protein
VPEATTTDQLAEARATMVVDEDEFETLQRTYFDTQFGVNSAIDMLTPPFLTPFHSEESYSEALVAASPQPLPNDNISDDFLDHLTWELPDLDFNHVRSIPGVSTGAAFCPAMTDVLSATSVVETEGTPPPNPR